MNKLLIILFALLFAICLSVRLGYFGKNEFNIYDNDENYLLEKYDFILFTYIKYYKKISIISIKPIDIINGNALQKN